MYHKLLSHNVWFLRHGVQQTDRWTDGQANGRKKWQIEVGVLHKKNLSDYVTVEIKAVFLWPLNA